MNLPQSEFLKKFTLWYFFIEYKRLDIHSEFKSNLLLNHTIFFLPFRISPLH